MASAAPPPVPADFAEYVARRLRPLEHAARQLHGDGAPAEALARELLSLVALRWTRLRSSDEEHHADPGAAADRYLRRLFDREARDAAPYQRVRLELDRTPPPRRPGRAVDVAAEAAALWARGRGVLRRRLLVAGGVVAAALAATGARGLSAAPAPVPSRSPFPALPSAVVDMPWVDVLAAAGEQQRLPWALVDQLPRELSPGAVAQLPALSARPAPHALALLTSGGAGHVLALGRDGAWRRVDAAPEQAGRHLDEGALSPDGAYAAFPLTDGWRVVEMATGRARNHLLRAPVVVWLGPGHLLFGEDALLEVATGRLLGAPLGSRDAVAVRRAAAGAAADTMLELLSVGEPITAPARVRRWEHHATQWVAATLAVGGEASGHLGPFRGAGFTVAGTGGLVARVCEPQALPAGLGRPADAAVAVLQPGTGEVRRLLAVDEETAGEVRLLGWLDLRRVLLYCAGGQGVAPRQGRRVLAWDVRDGRVGLVATAPGPGRLSLADLAGAV
ncbi:hypothetical protein [Catellatospora sp. NPDC049609]|uniref:hypothetical protein n=1 Tax=Catellatospora sp. NPDC049609 TaxID=3155505 RepID=UPI0034497305